MGHTILYDFFFVSDVYYHLLKTLYPPTKALMLLHHGFEY